MATALTAASFKIDTSISLGTGGRLVTGTVSGSVGYSTGGYSVSNTLAAAVFSGNIAFMNLGNAVRNSDGAVYGCAFNPTAKVAGSVQGKINFYNTGQSPHVHNLLVSGGVTLAANDHLGTQAGRLAQPGTGTTITSVDGASGVQNSTATGPATDVADNTALNGFVAPFCVLVT